MSLNSLHLDAFAAVAKLKSFSQAASKLNVTQSALSQRILNLEDELGSSLFIRESSGVRLTELGQRLLRYCHSRSLLETEFMESMRAKDAQGLSGIMSIAGFSTINRSVVMPILARLIRENPAVNIEIRTKELRDLPGLLFSGASDLILACQPIEKQGVENHLIGYEEYVLIQSSAKNSRDDIYLDHDEEDTTTMDFLKLQGRKPGPIKRNYVADIYGLIEGVKLGIGKGVAPLHLIKDVKGIEIVDDYNSMKVPVYLTYYSQAYFTRLQEAVTAEIRSHATDYLTKAKR